jgi:signal transduction histidine kinase
MAKRSISHHEQAERSADAYVPPTPDDHLAMAVHELRGLVSVLVGGADNLKTAWGNPEMEEYGRHVTELMARSGRRLRRLMLDLLTSAYLERGEVPLRLVRAHLLPILVAAVEGAGADADEVTIDCDPGVQVTTDMDRLEQIVGNLVGNAVHHGAAPVSVSVVLRADDGGTDIVVRDAGTGVSRANLIHLFQPFSASATLNSNSTGLGLAIARALARAMGGDLRYDRGRPGSRFTVSLAPG